MVIAYEDFMRILLLIKSIRHFFYIIAGILCFDRSAIYDRKVYLWCIVRHNFLYPVFILLDIQRAQRGCYSSDTDAQQTRSGH